MSLAGSTKRLLRLSEPGRALAFQAITGPWWKAILLTLYGSFLGIFLAVLYPVVWGVVLGWYATFGLWLVPYRLIRRADRNRKRDALQHREMLAAAAVTTEAVSRLKD